MLREAMTFIHIPTLDRFVDDLEYGFTPRNIFTLHTGFEGTVSSSLFHIYDTELASKISSFQTSWNTSLGFGSYFYPAGNNYTFLNTGTPAQAAAWKEVLLAAEELRTNMRVLLQHIRLHYMEVDLMQTSAEAWAGLLEIDEAAKATLTRRAASTPKKFDSLNPKVKRDPQRSVASSTRRRK
jgi:hypothetical protein